MPPPAAERGTVERHAMVGEPALVSAVANV
jgi:hypothetical protein